MATYFAELNSLHEHWRQTGKPPQDTHFDLELHGNHYWVHPSAAVIRDPSGYQLRHPNDIPVIRSAPPRSFVPRFLESSLVEDAEDTTLVNGSDVKPPLNRSPPSTALPPLRLQSSSSRPLYRVSGPGLIDQTLSGWHKAGPAAIGHAGVSVRRIGRAKARPAFGPGKAYVVFQGSSTGVFQGIYR